MEKTIEIPEGYEARIEGNKVILEPKESKDERIRKELLTYLEHEYLVDKTIKYSEYNKYVAWLEKQGKEEINEASYRTGIKRVLDNPESYGLKKQGEQKPAWSEEDEKIRQNIENLICFALRDGSVVAPAADTTKENALDWLKALKERCTWKPSDEQMSQLECIAKQNKDNILGKEFMTLFNDLKKLKG